jgi:hypothetical protein
MSPISGPDLGPQSQLFAFQRDIVDAIGAVTSILPRIILTSKARGQRRMAGHGAMPPE